MSAIISECGKYRYRLERHGLSGAGAIAGAEWFDGNLCVKSSNSPARKRGSAMIAKIPEPLARHIARVYHPRNGALTGN